MRNQRGVPVRCWFTIVAFTAAEMVRFGSSFPSRNLLDSLSERRAELGLNLSRFRTGDRAAVCGGISSDREIEGMSVS